MDLAAQTYNKLSGASTSSHAAAVIMHMTIPHTHTHTHTHIAQVRPKCPAFHHSESNLQYMHALATWKHYLSFTHMPHSRLAMHQL